MSIHALVLFSAILGLAAMLPSRAAEIHLSPTGMDANPGSATQPFGSLQRAQQEWRKLRQANPTEPITVIVHGGNYEQLAPLVLDEPDGNVTIRAKEGEKPIFQGSKKVEGFTVHQGSILKADVASLGLEKLSIRQLLHGGERQILARWPNFDPKDPLYGGWAFVQEVPKGTESHAWKSEFYIVEKDYRVWAHPEDVEVDIFAFYGWWNWIVPVKGFHESKRKLLLAKDCGYDIHPYNRYHLQNAMEELDAPGEWFLDRREQKLYFWPAKPFASGEVRVPTLENFVRVKKATGVQIQGLTFHGCVGTAVYFENTTSCTVAACTIAHCGGFSGTGIGIQGGTGNRAVGNDISFTGSNGIGLGGGDRKTLTPANNVAENNHIHHIGVLNKNAAGVTLNGVGNQVRHNLIHHGPRMAVQFSGNNLLIELNRVHHMVQETQDGGAFYTGGRDWISSRGTIIRHNFITDTLGVGQEKEGLRHPFFTWGIYMDDNTGGVDIVGNVVARSGRASLHLHNARDCNVENNIWIDGQEKQLEYDGWAKEDHYIKNHMVTMIQGWESVKDEPAWSAMRGMKVDPRRAFFPDGTMMSGNRITKNIVAWRDPNKRYVDFRHVRAEHNFSDQNLLWNGGSPIRTAVSKLGPDRGDDLLAGTGNFASAENGKTPKGWGFNHKPNASVQCRVVDGALVVDAGSGTDPKNTHSVFHGPNLPIKPGSGYRARLQVRSSLPALSVDFAFATFENGQGYWSTRPKIVSVTDQWQDVEFGGAMPKPGESSWKDWMKTFWLRVDVRGDTGNVQLRGVQIREAESLDEWASWQSEGWDKNVTIADPQFTYPAKDDFSLKPSSPAWKLGFSKIPLEKIGLYQDKLRASWPVNVQ